MAAVVAAMMIHHDRDQAMREADIENGEITNTVFQEGTEERKEIESAIVRGYSTKGITASVEREAQKDRKAYNASLLGRAARRWLLRMGPWMDSRLLAERLELESSVCIGGYPLTFSAFVCSHWATGVPVHVYLWLPSARVK